MRLASAIIAAIISLALLECVGVTGALLPEPEWPLLLEPLLEPLDLVPTWPAFEPLPAEPECEPFDGRTSALAPLPAWLAFRIPDCAPATSDCATLATFSAATPAPHCADACRSTLCGACELSWATPVLGA